MGSSFKQQMLPGKPPRATARSLSHGFLLNCNPESLPQTDSFLNTTKSLTAATAGGLKRQRRSGSAAVAASMPGELGCGPSGLSWGRMAPAQGHPEASPPRASPHVPQGTEEAVSKQLLSGRWRTSKPEFFLFSVQKVTHAFIPGNSVSTSQDTATGPPGTSLCAVHSRCHRRLQIKCHCQEPGEPPALCFQKTRFRPSRACAGLCISLRTTSRPQGDRETRVGRGQRPFVFGSRSDAEVACRTPAQQINGLLWPRSESTPIPSQQPVRGPVRPRLCWGKAVRRVGPAERAPRMLPKPQALSKGHLGPSSA